MLTVVPACAQTYDPNFPVCMKVIVMEGGEYYDCSFTSLAQCGASASGRSAQCLVNPYFAFPGTQPAVGSGDSSEFTKAYPGRHVVHCAVRRFI